MWRGLVPLATEKKEAGAGEGESGGGGLGDALSDDLYAVDGDGIRDSEEGGDLDIEVVCGEAVVADVVAHGAEADDVGLAVEVGIEASDSEGGGEFVVNVGGDSGIAEADLAAEVEGSGIAVDDDVVGGPAESGEVDAGDPNKCGDGRGGEGGTLAADVALHHEVVTGSGDVSGDGSGGRGIPENIDGVSAESVGMGQGAEDSGCGGPLVGWNDARDIRAGQGCGLGVAEEINGDGGNDRGFGRNDGEAGSDEDELTQGHG